LVSVGAPLPTLPVLLPGFGSVEPLWATVAVLVQTCPGPTPAATVVAMVMVAEAPDASDGIVIVRLLPDPLHTPPAVEAHDTKTTSAGRLSVTTTLRTVSPVALFTTRV
jgi:hypothetical protein